MKDKSIKTSEIREFATDRLLEDSRFVNSFPSSLKDVWKAKGRIDFAGELLHWIKTYETS